MALGHGGYGALRYGAASFSDDETYNFVLGETVSVSDSFDRTVQYFLTLIEQFVLAYAGISYGETPYGMGRSAGLKFNDELKFLYDAQYSEAFQTTETNAKLISTPYSETFQTVDSAPVFFTGKNMDETWLTAEVISMLAAVAYSEGWQNVDTLSNQPQLNYSEAWNTVDSAPVFLFGKNTNETWLTAETINFAMTVAYSEAWANVDTLGNMPIIGFSETWGQSDSLVNQAQLFLLEVAKVGFSYGMYGQNAYAGDGQGSVSFDTQIKFDMNQFNNETLDFNASLGNMPIIGFDEGFHTHLELFNGAILELIELAQVGYALKSYGQSAYSGETHGSVDFDERIKFDVNSYYNETLNFPDSLSNQPNLFKSEGWNSVDSIPNFLIGLVLVEAALAMGYALGSYGQSAFAGGFDNPGAFHFGEDFQFAISSFFAEGWNNDESLSNEPRVPLAETWNQIDTQVKMPMPNPQESVNITDAYDRIAQFFPNFSETWLTSDTFSHLTGFFLAETWNQVDSLSNQAGPNLQEGWNTIDSYPNFGIMQVLVEQTIPNAYLLNYMNGLFYFDLSEAPTVSDGTPIKDVTVAYSEGWNNVDTLANRPAKELQEATSATDSMATVIQFFRTFAETCQFDETLSKSVAIYKSESVQFVDTNILLEFIARLVIYQLDTRSHFSLGFADDKGAGRDYFQNNLYDLG